MATEGKSAIQKAYHSLQTMSLDEENRRVYEAREMFLHDQATRLYEAREEGMEIGRKEGREAGVELGREEVARNLLSLGMDEEFVIKATGIDQSILEKIKKTRAL